MNKLYKFWQVYKLVQYVLSEIDRIFHTDEVKR